MTGYFVRIERDGQWQNLDIGTMSDPELAAYFRSIEDRAKLIAWNVALASWIRDNVKAVSK